MKKTIITLVTVAMTILSAIADDTTYESLTFVKSDGTEVSYSVDGLRITFSNSNAVIKNDETTGVLGLSSLNYMYFSDADSSYLTGDVNGDGEVTIADVNVINDIILGSDVDADVEERADVNGDGEVSIADVNAVIDIILSAS